MRAVAMLQTLCNYNYKLKWCIWTHSFWTTSAHSFMTFIWTWMQYYLNFLTVYCSSSLLFDKEWGFLAQLLLFPASNKQFTRFHGDLNLSPGILVVVYKHKIRLCIANKWFYASFGFMSSHWGCFLNLKWCEKRIDVHF